MTTPSRIALVDIIGYALLIVGMACCLTGCGAKREQTERREERRDTVEKETTVVETQGYAPDGTPVVLVTRTTRFREETSKAEADTQIRSTTTLHAPEALTRLASMAAGSAGGPAGLGLAALLGWLTTTPEGAGTGLAAGGMLTMATRKFLGASRKASEVDALRERVAALEAERGEIEAAFSAVVRGNAIFLAENPEAVAAFKAAQRSAQADTTIKARVRRAAEGV